MSRAGCYWVQGYGGVLYERTEWLRMLHRGSGLSYQEVADRLGYSSSFVFQCMSGHWSNPMLETLAVFANVYGEGMYAAFGFAPVGWLRGRVKTTIEYSDKAAYKRTCIICGKRVGYRKKVLCGDPECDRIRANEHQRTNYWHSVHRQDPPSRESYRQTCEICGKPLDQSVGVPVKFCGPECYQTRQRERVMRCYYRKRERLLSAGVS